MHHKFSPGFYPGLEFVNSLATPSRIIQYYYRRGGYIPYIYRFLRQSILFQVTTAKSNTNLLTKNPTLTPLLFRLTSRHIMPVKYRSPLSSPLDLVNTTLCFNLHLAQIVSLYQIFGLLFKSTLK